MSTTQIQQEKQNFLNALNRGQITPEEYQQAMSVYKDQPAPPVINDSKENPYSQVNVQKDRFNPVTTPEQYRILAADTEQMARQNEARKQNLITTFNQIESLPVASSNEEAVAKGYSYYITPEQKDQTVRDIGKGYQTYQQNQQVIASTKQQQQAIFRETTTNQQTNRQNIIAAETQQQKSVSLARQMGLPDTIGEKYDLTKTNIAPDTVTGYKEVTYNPASYGLPGRKTGETKTVLQIYTKPQADFNLEDAKTAQIQLGKIGIVKAQSGTRGTELNIEQYASQQQSIRNKLNPSDLAEFDKWQIERTTTPVKNLGLFLGAAVTAPVLGGVGAVKAIGLGLGITQGFKSVGQAIQGQPLTILTPQEAYEGATTGVIFSGASKVVTGAIMSTPKTAPIITGYGVGATKTVTSIMGESTVNAGIGAIGGAILSGGDPMVTTESAGFAVGLGLFGRGIGAVRGIKHTNPYTKTDNTPNIIESKNTPSKINTNSLKQTDTTISETNAKIDTQIRQRNVDVEGINTKINNQINQSKSVDVSKANSNIDAAVKEMNAEIAQMNAAKKGGTIISNNTPDAFNIKGNNYVIRQPQRTNLNLNEQIQFGRGPVNVAEAEAKLGGYDMYRSTMSEGLTATKTRTLTSQRGDAQLARIEQMTRTPYQTTTQNTNPPVTKATKPILPTSTTNVENLAKPTGRTSGLIPMFNPNKIVSMNTNKYTQSVSGGMLPEQKTMLLQRSTIDVKGANAKIGLLENMNIRNSNVNIGNSHVGETVRGLPALSNNVNIFSNPDNVDIITNNRVDTPTKIETIFDTPTKIETIFDTPTKIDTITSTEVPQGISTSSGLKPRMLFAGTGSLSGGPDRHSFGRGRKRSYKKEYPVLDAKALLSGI